MYLSFIHQIISMILFPNLYQLVYSDNNNIPLKLISNQTQNTPFNLMIAFGIQRTDDDEQQKFDPDHSEEEFQENTRLLLLPLMIRMLFERLANATDQSNDVQTSYEINYKSNTNKQNIMYESIRRFITITIDVNKVEKATVMVFLILSFTIFLFTIFSIIRRLRNAHKFHFVRIGSPSIHSRNNHEETKKLLP